MQGHCDWVRSVAVSQRDDCVVSGDMRGAVFAWDLASLQGKRNAVLPVDPVIELNTIMSVEFDPCHSEVFYALQRSGYLTICDLRTAGLQTSHFRCHFGRGSVVHPCFLSPHIATSARGSEMKLWDFRRISPPPSTDQYIQIYNKHVSEKLFIGFDFLLNEKLIVTGSDSFSAFVYNTATGELLKTVQLAPEQVGTVSATARDSLSFYAVYNNGENLGVVDTEGQTITHDYTSGDQIKEIYRKEAYATALSHHADRLLSAFRGLEGVTAINYEQLIPLVSASQLPVCKQLMQDIHTEFEDNLKKCTPKLVRDLQTYYQRYSRNNVSEDCVKKRRKVRDGRERKTMKVRVERSVCSEDRK